MQSLKDHLNDAIDRVTGLYVRTCGVSETLSMIAEKADEHKDALCNLTMSLNEISRGMRVLRGYLYNDIARYGHVQETDAAPDEIPDFNYWDFTETDKPYKFLYEQSGNVSELRFAQISAQLAERAEQVEFHDFSKLYQAYLHDMMKRKPEESDADDTANSEPAATDREERLRTIAEAVSGLPRKDWSDAKMKIDHLFSYPANAAANNAVIDRTPDEIADILNKGW